jgi:Flp pilus assembly protein CpaB
MRVQNQQGPKKIMPIPLVFLLVAGACLILVFNTTHVQYKQKSYVYPETAEVAMARVSLPTMTVITPDHIKTELVSKKELPQGKLVSPTQIIGRTLAVPVVEGQVLTESCFVRLSMVFPPSEIPEIPKEMRVFSVPITSRVNPDHIPLYPGCLVNVLVEYKLDRNFVREALSQTMFRGLRVLAISGNSVISTSEKEDGSQRRDSHKIVVTLLVELKQAEALQLAIGNGTITLSIHNPLHGRTFDFRKKQRKPLDMINHWKWQPPDDHPVEKNGIWKKNDVWQLIPDDRPSRLWPCSIG